jgi:hypothetical protein
VVNEFKRKRKSVRFKQIEINCGEFIVLEYFIK